MKKTIISFVAGILIVGSCNLSTQQNNKQANNNLNQDTIAMKSGYATVNNLHMYYEIYGAGKPLVLLHGGGSTIQTTFGRIIPMLAHKHQIIGVELQAHGRSGDRNTQLSFEQDADDVAELLKQLQIQKADIFGFSNGGTTALQIAIRHPEITGKVISASALCKRSGAPETFWNFMNNATIDQMPKVFKDEYKKVAPDPNHLQTMHDKCVVRMQTFKDIPDSLLQSIQSPVLIMMGDHDVATPEHAVEMSRLIPNSRLAIFPSGHGDYIGEITTLGKGYQDSDYSVHLIELFLSDDVKK